MRNISNRKKFIESEFPPEDTNVIWVKIGHDGSSNINALRFTDMLQFINGEWTSILPVDGSEDTSGNKVIIKQVVSAYEGAPGYQCVIGKDVDDGLFIDNNPYITRLLENTGYSSNNWFINTGWILMVSDSDLEWKWLDNSIFFNTVQYSDPVFPAYIYIQTIRAYRVEDRENININMKDAILTKEFSDLIEKNLKDYTRDYPSLSLPK